jgi:stromal membrane-associated protein
VISVNLDEWTDDEVNCLANSGGNATVNTRYEAFLPENYKKSRVDFATEERATFIRYKIGFFYHRYFSVTLLMGLFFLSLYMQEKI